MAKKHLKLIRFGTIALVLVMLVSIIPFQVGATVWTEVSTFEQFRWALESPSITHVRLTHDIQIGDNGVRINAAKRELIIDGNNRTMNGFRSNKRGDSIRLADSGTLRHITIMNARINSFSNDGFMTVRSKSRFGDVHLTFQNIIFNGPQLVRARDSWVTLRDGNYRIIPGHREKVDELVEATHIRLEGNLELYKDAPGRHEIFSIERRQGGITIARGARVNARLNRDHRRTHKAGFIHMEKKGGYIRFEEDSHFTFHGNGFFMQDRCLQEFTVGARAEVYIYTHGRFRGKQYGIVMIRRGFMTVQQDAIVHLIAIGNDRRAAMVQLDKKTSTVTFNSPREVFIYNSSTHRRDRGHAIGLEGNADRFTISYNNIRDLAYWENNVFPPDNLPTPTYFWQNPDNSAFSVAHVMDRRGVHFLNTINYRGVTPITPHTMHLYDINVIHLHGGTPEHIVTFDANGGYPDPEPQRVREGGLATTPVEPYYPLKRLVGWFRNPGGTGAPWNFATDRVMSSMTLYASWEYRAMVRVRYMSDIYGTQYYDSYVGAGSSYVLKSGAEVGFYRDGFLVGSWDTRADCFGLRHAIHEVINPTYDTTIFAIWTPSRMGGIDGELDYEDYDDHEEDPYDPGDDEDYDGVYGGTGIEIIVSDLPPDEDAGGPGADGLAGENGTNEDAAFPGANEDDIFTGAGGEDASPTGAYEDTGNPEADEYSRGDDIFIQTGYNEEGAAEPGGGY